MAVGAAYGAGETGGAIAGIGVPAWAVDPKTGIGRPQLPQKLAFGPTGPRHHGQAAAWLETWTATAPAARCGIGRPQLPQKLAVAMI
jgi:hypothetical protein